MKELNGVETYIKASITNRTWKETRKYTRFHENIQDFATTVDVICAQIS